MQIKREKHKYLEYALCFSPKHRVMERLYLASTQVMYALNKVLQNRMDEARNYVIKTPVVICTNLRTESIRPPNLSCPLPECLTILHN